MRIMSRVYPGSCELYNVRKRDVTQAGMKIDADDILCLFSLLQSTTHVQHRPNGGTTYLYEWNDTSKKKSPIHLSRICNNFMVVERPFLKPNYLLLNKLFILK